MPQIGWFEILIIVVLSIIIIGPKDFPIVLKKIGGWMGSIKRYFNEIQKGMTDMGKCCGRRSFSKRKLFKKS